MRSIDVVHSTIINQALLRRQQKLRYVFYFYMLVFTSLFFVCVESQVDEKSEYRRLELMNMAKIWCGVHPTTLMTKDGTNYA